MTLFLTAKPSYNPLMIDFGDRISRIRPALAGLLPSSGLFRSSRRGDEAAPVLDMAEGDGDKASGNDRPGDKPGPRNPWQPQAGAGDNRRPPAIEDIFRKRGGGGGGGGFPGGPQFRIPQGLAGTSWASLAVGAVVLLWLGTTMVHRISPQEKGVVTTFGSYTRLIDSGMALTLPWPIQSVSTEDVTSIRRESIPEGDGEKLMLTGDQNLVDLTYLVRWSIKDLKLYKFQLADPDQTVREVAEAAMRQSIAEVQLNDAMGSGRATIEQQVRERMQRVLDAYRAGVTIQGVEIKKTDPPTKVVDAFKEVLAAQQEAQSEINRAEAWAQQLTASAQGEAASFDKVYAQYKLAPEVTRRRMYYETMERVLSQTDKVIVEAPGTVPFLPLPQMMQQQASPPPAKPQEGR